MLPFHLPCMGWRAQGLFCWRQQGWGGSPLGSSTAEGGAGARPSAGAEGSAARATAGAFPPDTGGGFTLRGGRHWPGRGSDGAGPCRVVLSNLLRARGQSTLPLGAPAPKILPCCSQVPPWCTFHNILPVRVRISDVTRLTSLWQTVHRVCRFSREHCPPPL